MTAAEVVMRPQNTAQLDEGQASTMLKLMENLEDNDDVQKVYTNADFPPEVLEQYGVAS